MSFTAARISRRIRAVCQRCRDRKARFQTKGVVRADRDHTLCFECFRAERERQRAGALAARARPAGLPFLRPGSRRADPGAPAPMEGQGRVQEVAMSPLAAGAGGNDALQKHAHRRRMLAHLEGSLAHGTGS